MDTVRRYSMLIDGDWVDTDDRAIGAAKAAHADGTPPA
jgi:hypothetical protein